MVQRKECGSQHQNPGDLILHLGHTLGMAVIPVLPRCSIAMGDSMDNIKESTSQMIKCKVIVAQK